MPAIKGVLFDLGNTLLQFVGSWPEVFSKADNQLFTALQNAGFALDETAFKTEFRARLTAYFQERDSEFIELTTAYILRSLLDELGFQNIPDEVIRPALKQMYAVSQAQWDLEEDCIPMLKKLKSQGFRMGIISNASDDSDVQTLVDQNNIRPYFDFVISSAGFGIRKPNPSIFMAGLEAWDIPAEEAVMVGDTLGADILGARNAGIYSIWVIRRSDSPGNQDHAETIFPDAQIETLAELPDLLTQITIKGGE